jgi:hypothetical protein
VLTARSGRIQTAKTTAAIVAVVLAFLLCAYIILLWFVFLPFRMACRLRLSPAQRRRGIDWRELEIVAALAASAVALLRSRHAPGLAREWNRRRWRKAHRKLMAERPDDEIPF